ncbi:alpha/beta hydrolase [Ferrovibrio sp.]|uniref:alpha/beta hydrolase n=1 Tax=Ferrovibrio sp. TaxID=1917215 RepID=UPI00263315CB|nr:alpha/beta hydrolase [Ferrovibrio sp.]
MDRATLDRLYNNRAAVPTHQQDMDRWAAESAAARQALVCRLDLAYGAHPRETLDLFTLPEPGRPLLVFIHGGYWQALDKSSFSFIANGFAGSGDSPLANVAILNYPLAPEADLDRIVASIRRALLWLWREAAPLDFDRNRIFVSGHSAGGHLTAMAALTEWEKLDGGAPADLVKGGMSISGLYDLLPIRHCYLNDRLGMDDVVAMRNSPLGLVAGWARPLPPLICAVGGAETLAFPEQQHDFVTAYRLRGGKVTAITAPDCHHFDILYGMARPGGDLQSAVASMLR